MAQGLIGYGGAPCIAGASGHILSQFVFTNNTLSGIENGKGGAMSFIDTSVFLHKCKH